MAECGFLNYMGGSMMLSQRTKKQSVLILVRSTPLLRAHVSTSQHGIREVSPQALVSSCLSVTIAAVSVYPCVTLFMGSPSLQIVLGHTFLTPALCIQPWKAFHFSYTPCRQNSALLMGEHRNPSCLDSDHRFCRTQKKGSSPGSV